MVKRSSSKKLIRVGVVGVGRGQGFARGAGEHLGMKLVALCDAWKERLDPLAKQLNVAAYTEYEKFLEHDMDAVILANYFHEHAPFAVKALNAGKHVMSETAACFTLGEGVALVEAVERSKKIYMFAENYPYMLFNQEMRKIYQSGRIGQFTYGEGEYVHPGDADFVNRISPGINHWRNWLPATYYCTHSLAPVMFITDTMPVKVNGFVMPRPTDDPVFARCVRCNDAASMIAVRMDNGAVVKLLHVGLRGHGVWVRIHGSLGQMENLRHENTAMVRIRREQYHEEKTEPVERIYLPTFPEEHAEAVKSGHGGGDYFMNYHFAEAIRRNEPPYLNVYRGVAMSCVGILAYKSALSDSNTFEVPNFRDKKARAKYANDEWNPNPLRRKPCGAEPTRSAPPWPSITGEIKPTKMGMEYAKKIWRSIGYLGD